MTETREEATPSDEEHSTTPDTAPPDSNAEGRKQPPGTREEEVLSGQDTSKEDLAAAVQRLDARLAELEAGLAALEETVTSLSGTVERNSEELRDVFQTLTPLRKLVIGDGHDDPPLVVMKHLRETHGPLNHQLAALTHELSDVRDDVNEEIEREVGVLRAEQNAKLRRLAAETGVELGVDTATNETGTGDVISRVRADGIDAVRAAPRKRDRRAALVLEHIEAWGTKERLRAGPAYRLPRPRVKRLLNATDAITVTMTSKTVGDVFDAIEQLAAGSPRLVQRRKHDGVDNLYVGFPGTDSNECT